MTDKTPPKPPQVPAKANRREDRDLFEHHREPRWWNPAPRG